MAVVELTCGAQSYDWGKLGKDGSKVSHFALGSEGFVYDAEKPYAELWMGTHPSCPSTLVSTGQSLKDYLTEHPEYLGDKVVKKFGVDLPFLFKVLAIRKALSIQAHPDKKLAERLFATQPNVYKDPNHKPEMAVALTAFSGFCGFRPPVEIAKFLQSVPEFKNVIESSISADFINEFAVDSADESLKKVQLKRLFTSLMLVDAEKAKTEVASLIKNVDSYASLTAEEKTLIKTLNEDFPGDVGIFCLFVLNIVNLQPGQAVFLMANVPHAYLSGDIMECMATSDNVVRAGLTPKLRDVETLTEMLTYSSSSPEEQILPPVKFRDTQHTTVYDPPIDEFTVLLTNLEEGETETFGQIEGPSILIITELSPLTKVSITSGTTLVSPHREGQVYFIPANTPVSIASEGGKTVAYRAFVEA